MNVWTCILLRVFDSYIVEHQKQRVADQKLSFKFNFTRGTLIMNID